MAELLDSSTVFEDNTEQAPADLYTEWLFDYLDNGGVPVHMRNHSVTRREWELVTRDSDIPDLKGSKSRSLIIPESVTVDDTDIGHNDIFYLGTGLAHNRTSVSIFSDHIEHVVEQYPETIEKMGAVAFFLQGSCANSTCQWESGVTNSSDNLLHALSKHTCETGHGVHVMEVVADAPDEQFENRREIEIYHSRQYNAGL